MDRVEDVEYPGTFVQTYRIVLITGLPVYEGIVPENPD